MVSKLASPPSSLTLVSKELAGFFVSVCVPALVASWQAELAATRFRFAPLFLYVWELLFILLTLHWKIIDVISPIFDQCACLSRPCGKLSERSPTNWL